MGVCQFGWLTAHSFLKSLGAAFFSLQADRPLTEPKQRHSEGKGQRGSWDNVAAIRGDAGELWKLWLKGG